MSDVYSTTMLFEHPLNEKILTWLRSSYYSSFTGIRL